MKNNLFSAMVVILAIMVVASGCIEESYSRNALTAGGGGGGGTTIINNTYYGTMNQTPNMTPGTPGAPGSPGTAATINVNYTFTGSSGTSALVSNIGTVNAAIFDFTIPQGVNGTPGVPGPAGPTGPMNQTVNMTANMTAGPIGPTGGFSIFYTFSTTTAAPPADKTVRYNSGTPASVTLIYIDETDRFGIDNIAFLNSISIGSSLMFANETTRDLYHIYNVTSITDSGDYFTVGTDSFSGNPSTFSNNMPIFMSVAKKGNVGASAPDDPSQDANILLQADSHIASNKSQILTAVNANETLLQSIANDSKWDLGYTIPVQFLTGTWANSTTYYFGNIPADVTSTANARRIYIVKGGNITGAEIWVASGTAGSDQGWQMDIVKNGATNGNTTTIGNVSTALSPLYRRWSNTSGTMRIKVDRGDYIEIKTQINLFPVKPATSIGGGYLYVDS